MRILIVEDEPTLGQQLKSTLEQNGYAVDLSTDGEDGHFLGSTEEYDAVILDLGLPEIDGLTALGFTIDANRGENSGIHIVRMQDDGTLIGGADPRREGIVGEP